MKKGVREREKGILGDDRLPPNIMILDAHTHIFPEEICRQRDDYFADEPAFRLLYESPKSKMVGPEGMLKALEEEGVEAAVVLGFPLDKLSVEDSPVFEFSVGGRDF